MTQVRLQPEPTFEAPVSIHVPGKGELEMRWTFKYRNEEQLKKLRVKWFGDDAAKAPEGETAEKFDTIGYVMDIASGWELAEAFTRKNLEIFFRNYNGTQLKVSAAYYEELAGARRKNS